MTVVKAVLVVFTVVVDAGTVVAAVGTFPLHEHTDEKRVPVQSDAYAGIAVAEAELVTGQAGVALASSMSLFRLPDVTVAVTVVVVLNVSVSTLVVVVVVVGVVVVVEVEVTVTVAPTAGAVEMIVVVRKAVPPTLVIVAVEVVVLIISRSISLSFKYSSLYRIPCTGCDGLLQVRRAGADSRGRSSWCCCPEYLPWCEYRSTLILVLRSTHISITVVTIARGTCL